MYMHEWQPGMPPVREDAEIIRELLEDAEKLPALLHEYRACRRTSPIEPMQERLTANLTSLREAITAITDNPGENPPLVGEDRARALLVVAEIDGMVTERHRRKGFPEKLDPDDVEHAVIAFCAMLLCGDDIPYHPTYLDSDSTNLSTPT